MLKVRFDYVHVPTIGRFFYDNSYIKALMGPFGSGKSSGCAMEIVSRASRVRRGPDGTRRSRWLVVRNTYPQLKDTTIPTFLHWFPPGYAGTWVPSEHNYLLRIKPDIEAEIMFRALDKPEHVKNLLSLEVTGAWGNEAREIPWAIIEALEGRVGRYPSVPDGGAFDDEGQPLDCIILDTNPPDLDSDFYRFFEGNPDTGEPPAANAARSDGRRHGTLFRQPSGLSLEAENLPNLKPGYYVDLAIGKDREYQKVYIEGQYGFVVDGRPVYETDYDDSVHCREFDWIPNVPIDVGWDFGLTPAIVLTQMPPSGRWQVFDEVCGRGIGIEKFLAYAIPYLKKTYPGQRFTHTADPAGNKRSEADEKTCYQIMRAKPYNLIVDPGAETLTMRIESVRRPLNARNGFLMHPRCKVLRKGFMGGYQFRRVRVTEERYDEEPAKNQYSHPHDALQMVASKIFGPGLVHPGGPREVKGDVDFDVFDRGGRLQEYT